MYIQLLDLSRNSEESVVHLPVKLLCVSRAFARPKVGRSRANRVPVPSLPQPASECGVSTIGYVDRTFKFDFKLNFNVGND